ncbi:MAG: hypothetical protein MZV63_26695 [Marinilabiliales bacterium]|nr:hypothetical protein [Marinilabiliales bacterium]
MNGLMHVWATSIQREFPLENILKSAQAMSNADNYISSYNIYMGTLLNSKGQKLFPEDLVLITHWGLRDELKSNFNVKNGLEKQRLIYEVMKRIIDQSIPESTINSGVHTWNPYLNKVYRDGKVCAFKSEPNTRYQHLLNNFQAARKMDAFCSALSNGHYESF